MGTVVVVAAALVRDGRLLLCHRRDDAPRYPAVWDLPGGHVERGEAPDAAVVRECAEELGIRVTSLGGRREYRSDGTELTVFRVEAWEGEPHNAEPREHQDIRWCDASDLRDLPLVDPRLETLALALLS